MASAMEEDTHGPGKRVAVVGAGVSGLAAAYKLKAHGLNVTVFEAEGRAGGKLKSVSKDGLIWDEGANTMTESEMEVRCLLDDLGIRDKQQSPISQTKRYIVRNGIPVLLPTNLIDLFKSNILSAQSKFRIMLEPVLWKKRDSSKLSDAQNVERLLIIWLILLLLAQALEILILFVFGSIIAGAVRSKFTGRREKSQETKSSLDKKKHQRGSFSFFGGMQTIADRLCKELDRDELKLNSKVLSLSYSHDGKSALENWSVSCSLNSDKHSQGSNFDAVIMAAPLCNVEEMKISKGGQIFPLDFLPQVSYMPLSVIITAFKKANVKRPLEGFGVLVPSKEQQNGLKSLGTLFSSMMFPDRAPSDIHLYTTFIGGSRNKELAKTSTEELKEIVTSDLRQLLGVEGEPLYVNHFYWSKAFPLYGLNYGSVLEAIEKMEENLPGFFYAGNHRGGLSVGKAITSGCSAADLVISYLESSSDDKMKMFKDESSL
ncbi:protoporphyrinogen oxidase 2, chloroplastic/mitochondrial isoform X2 [Tripterygium wilfordii]|uniref:protoporphyrinogen oxidase 2, chloroplastic/mitochondrial isoform X2 n=1 Tax=Tripterygium wilfordii TaxID=458696 RepID=UPI0018F81AE1|nr:protoporphyrinogen oxidase 2, chloroplastic/mitochondrial isoform X2 [Tripterygium wilfordii]